MNLVARLQSLTEKSLELLDELVGADVPRLYYHPQGQLAPLIDALPRLKNKYRPTPWLANTHAHLIYFDKIRKRTVQLNYDRVDQLTMSDGGITGIAWYGLDLPAHVPTILVLHTITGSTNSMRELVKDLHQYTGWRIALCLRRGHAGLPLSVPKINLFGDTQDLREQIQYIQQHFPQSTLYAVGSSAGTGLLVRYLGEEGKQTPIQAAFALCPGYNTETGFSYVHPVYSRMMAKKLVQHFIQPYANVWQSNPAIDKVLQAKDLAEFEQAYFELAGYHDYVSYCQATNPIYVFEQISIPLMILNAEDDPVCNITNLGPYKKVIQRMPNMVVVTTKKGSHCGFYEGVRPTKSWAHQLMAEFFQLQSEQVTSHPLSKSCIN